MDDQLQQLIPVARLLGISFASALSAYIASFSLVGIPIVQSAKDGNVMAKQWSRMFHIGADSAPPLAIACSTIFSFLAWQSRGIQGKLPLSATTLYILAAVTVPCIAPYTLTVMLDGVRQLEAKATGAHDAPSDAEAKALIEIWRSQNLVRASIVGTAAVSSAIAMVS